MNTPNLFNFATKELSQDAFICWLLAWADKAHENDELHHIGMQLLKSLVSKFDREHSIEIQTIQVRQQYKRIDILCLINTTFANIRDAKKNKKTEKVPANSLAIIIEDKVGAGLHGQQLSKYFKSVENLGFPENQILRIYLKTRDQLNLTAIEKDGYKAFIREDILKVLKNYQGKNHILHDFINFWEKIENDTIGFKETDYSNWSKSSWMGLYTALKKSESDQLNQGNNGKKSYGKNSAPTYGPLFKLEKMGYQFYIRLYKDKLNLIVKVVDSEKSDQELISLRNNWLKYLTKTNFIENHKIERPARILKKMVKNRELVIGCMDYMDPPYTKNSEKKINLEKTLMNLHSIGTFMQTKFINDLHVD